MYSLYTSFFYASETQNFFCYSFNNTMKIQSVQNYQYNYKFTGASVPHYHLNNSENGNKEDKPQKPMPEWARKGALATLLFFAFKNDPAVQNLMLSDETKREEKYKTEFLQDSYLLDSKYNSSPAMYHLNRLVDVDNINIKPEPFGSALNVRIIQYIIYINPMCV